MKTFTKDFTLQEPIPQEGIELALGVMQTGRLHRYNTMPGEKGYAAEHNMLAAGFYSHIKEMYPKYIEREGSDRRMIIDYIAGMTDNFTLDCANEILKPDHLNVEIEQSITGRWFDAVRTGGR